MISIERAEEIIRSFQKRRILVVGDLILDRYVCGSVSRISPEAPVPVVRVTDEQRRPGGAANVASNIQRLGGQAVVAGIVGRDQAAEELADILSESGICTDGVIAHDRIRTTVKTRILAERQQVVRVDYEDSPDAAADIAAVLCRKVAGLLDGINGVIIEDYGKGAVTQMLIQTVLDAARASATPVGLDPKDTHELDFSGITLATPNYKEACAAAGLRISGPDREPESDKRLHEAGDILMRKWNPELLIITLGPYGMYLRPRNADTQVIPTKAREVFDVSGAGDTVIATALLCLVSGANYYEAASLANYAAGVVVGKLGTATCSPQELLEHIE